MLCDGYRVVALAEQASFSPQGPAGGRRSPDWSYRAIGYEAQGAPFPGRPPRASLCLWGLQDSRHPDPSSPAVSLTHSPVDAEKSNLCLELPAQLARLNPLSKTQGQGNLQPTRQAKAEWLMVIFFFFPNFLEVCVCAAFGLCILILSCPVPLAETHTENPDGGRDIEEKEASSVLW